MTTPNAPGPPSSRPAPLGRTAAALVCATAVVLAVAGCGSAGGSGSGTGSGSDAGKPVTITFWHQWSDPSEIAAVNADIAGFEKLYPNIRVNTVANVSDPVMTKALQAGSANAPDVVSDSDTLDVGPLCSAGELVDLGPLMQNSGIDPAATFPKEMLNYSQYQGKQCTLPLLGDAYGLYYNIDMFRAAGISGPPHTFSQLAADAVKLTKGNGTQQLGYMPLYEDYQNDTGTLVAQYNPQYLTAAGKSNFAGDPGFAQLLDWQRNLVNQLGGYPLLSRIDSSFGGEYTANAFDQGRVAMQVDGEWRVAMLTQEKVPFQWATAPFPVPDDQEAQYGRGLLAGTVIGISRNSREQQAAWQFVRYLTTDTSAVVDFANAIENVPSTYAALDSPALQLPAAFQTFLTIADNQYSVTQPATADGGNYLAVLQTLGTQYESGKVTDLAAGLRAADRTEDSSLAEAGRTAG